MPCTHKQCKETSKRRQFSGAPNHCTEQSQIPLRQPFLITLACLF
uniref:Uncharacterized protein n=1 Tax=Anguilla anguilla TaxID=7936 RepID=A0A0E9U2X7_ANGAN